MDPTTDAGHGSCRSSSDAREWSESHSHAAMIHRDDDGTTTTNHDGGRDDQPNPNIVWITQQAKPRNCITAAMNMLVSSDKLSDEGRFTACLPACLPLACLLACLLSTFSAIGIIIHLTPPLTHATNTIITYTSNWTPSSHTCMYIYI